MKDIRLYTTGIVLFVAGTLAGNALAQTAFAPASIGAVSYPASLTETPGASLPITMQVLPKGTCLLQIHICGMAHAIHAAKRQSIARGDLKVRYSCGLGEPGMPELIILGPHPVLRDCVSHYSLRNANLGTLRQIHPIHARSDQILEFYLRDRYLIRNVSTGLVTEAPGVVVVGPNRSYKEDLVRTGTLRVFTIHFQPTGFHCMFHLPMELVASEAIPASQLLGNSLSALLDRLQHANETTELVEHANTYLIRKLSNALPSHPVHRAAYQLKQARGTLAIAELAQRTGLSLRQFERLFRQQVGFSPKLYSRIVRFECALASKVRYPEHSWTRVALDAGYSDQAHLIREAHAFSSAAPRLLMTSLDI